MKNLEVISASLSYLEIDTKKINRDVQISWSTEAHYKLASSLSRELPRIGRRVWNITQVNSANDAWMTYMKFVRRDMEVQSLSTPVKDQVDSLEESLRYSHRELLDAFF